jgi:hypothetical protein
VGTNRRTGTSISSVRTASAQARDFLGRLLVAELLDEGGDQLLKSQLVRGAVGPDIVEARLDELLHASFDLVADLAHAFEWLAGRIVDLPVLDL